jgi:hypothetical protein
MRSENLSRGESAWATIPPPANAANPTNELQRGMGVTECHGIGGKLYG